jgi:hypothetical protein
MATSTPASEARKTGDDERLQEFRGTWRDAWLAVGHRRTLQTTDAPVEGGLRTPCRAGGRCLTKQREGKKGKSPPMPPPPVKVPR